MSICNQIFVYAEVVQLYERDPRPGSTKNSYMKKKYCIKFSHHSFLEANNKDAVTDCTPREKT